MAREMRSIRAVSPSHRGLRAVPSFHGDVAEATSSGRRFAATVVIVVLAVVTICGVLVWNSGAEWRAIGRLPPEERRPLYERTLRTLQSPCGTQKARNGLEDFCRDQAAFILKFPECDKACQVLARAHLSSPSK
jgi:hypothetical protein